MVYDAERCASNAEADKTNSYGMCLQQTREWCGIAAKYGDAAEAWSHTKKRRAGNRQPPRGAPVWWTGGSHGYGHIALSLGNGKIRSTDAGGSGKVATVDLSWPEQHWNLHYAGWSEDLNDVTIPGLKKSSPTLHGLDVSHYQAGINLASTGLDFVVAKATQGHHTDDPEWRTFMSQAKSAGMLRGLYHFAENDGDLKGEADHYLSTVSGYVGSVVLVLDWEKGNLGNVSGAKAWLDRVRSRTGIKPLIYMSQSVTNSYDWSQVAKDYGLWVARYNDQIGSTGAWKSVVMWQYTSSGHEGGYTVDLDRFYGDRQAWNNYATGSTGGTGGGTVSDASRAVWDENLNLWFPGDQNTKDTMPAGQQMHQARGYAQEAYKEAKVAHDDARQIKQALRQLVKDPIFKGSTAEHVNSVLKSE